jgi:flagellar M-ring protein FliF
MRTDNPPPQPQAIARLREALDRAGRRVWAQGPAARWALALVAVAAIVAIGYLAAPSPSRGVYLRSGQRFSSDEVARIARALDDKHLYYRVDDRRVEVAADHYDEATAALAKLDVGPPSIAEIRKHAEQPSPWLSPSEIERREHRAKEERMAAMIRNFEGIVSADVTINRPPGRGFRPGPDPTAFVYLETEGDREIAHKTVQSIQNLIIAAEPALKRDAVTIIDKTGRHYLDAGDPATGEISRTRAREEELAGQILDQLDWIKGVRVVVQLVAAPSATAVPAAPPAADAGAAVKVNQPVGDPEPGPVSPPPAPRPGPEIALARVMVNVPRSFYYLKALPNRAPSDDDMQVIVARTKDLIKANVDHVLPPGEPRSEVLINTIPDDMPAAVLGPPAVAEARRPVDWWVPAGAAVAAAAALISVVGLRLLATRRPGARPATTAPRGRDRRDVASEAGRGASERVRELIRRNPEAAAGALNRWIGQGGHPG